jgi:prephenate dehydratase
MSPEATTVAYPGRAGAHSALAGELLFPAAELRPQPTFGAVAQAVVDHRVDVGVLPIESSLVGPVSETHDLLYESPLSIVGEVVIPVHHCVIGPAVVPLDSVRVVHSHPVALDQCRRLLESLPGAVGVAAPTTADAAKLVAEQQDRTHAAIASERAAHLFGLIVLEKNVGDHPEAYTRFVAIATYTRLDREGRMFRTAFSFATDHSPGALHRAIEPFARYEIDLLQLVSRPIPDTPWRYRFDAVLAGHVTDSGVRQALVEARARTRRLVVFGSYPAFEPSRQDVRL